MSWSFGGAPKIVTVVGLPGGISARISDGTTNGWSTPLELNITFALPLNSKNCEIVVRSKPCEDELFPAPTSGFGSGAPTVRVTFIMPAMKNELPWSPAIKRPVT